MNTRNTNKKLKAWLCCAVVYVLFISTINYAASSQTQQSFNDLIILLDTNEDETELKAGAMAIGFLIALQKKVAPIIITKKIAEIFCSLIKTVGVDNLKQMREALNTKNQSVVKAKAEEIFGRLLPGVPLQQKLSALEAKWLPILSAIDFDNNSWQGYMHKTENLVLLIPQAYINMKEQKDITACGFALNNLNKIPDLSINKFSEFLKNNERNLGAADAFMDGLESMFCNKELQPTSQNIIYLAGHGGAAEIINRKSLAEEIEKLQSYVAAGKQSLEELEQQKVDNLPMSEANIQKKLEELKKSIYEIQADLEKSQNFLKMAQRLQSLEGIESAQWDIANKKQELEKLEKSLNELLKAGNLSEIEMDKKQKLEELEKRINGAREYIELNQKTLAAYQNKLQNAGKGNITPSIMADLSFANFSRFMKFLNTKTQTSFLYYTTCFGGGVNQAFLNDELKKLNVNFVVAAEGIAETTTRVSLNFPSISANKWIFSPQRLDDFFKLSHSFFGFGALTPEEIKVAQQSFKQNPLKMIMQSALSGGAAFIVENAPFIRFPSVGVFSAVNADDKIKILTNSIVRAYELEGNDINVSNKNIVAVIIYPRRIGVPLILNGKTSIILPTPTEITPSYIASCIFEKIEYKGFLSSLVYDISVHNASRYKKAFLIKSLTMQGDKASGLPEAEEGKTININNMIALLSPNELQLTNVAGKLDICFEFEGNAYCGTMPIESFGNRFAIADAYKAFNVAPATAQLITDLASEVLGQRTWPTKPLAALTEFAQAFDDSVEKNVVEPGVLKNVLQKQLQQQKN